MKRANSHNKEGHRQKEARTWWAWHCKSVTESTQHEPVEQVTPPKATT